MAALAEDDVGDAPRGSQSVRDKKKHYEKQKACRATQEMRTRVMLISARNARKQIKGAADRE